MNKEFEINTLKEYAKELKVLYVENHAGTRLKFSVILKEYFEEVFVTPYADNALQVFENGHFDLIISDLVLPDIDAEIICRKIKNIAPKKPIIIVSNIKDADKIIELINIGISGFVETPLEKDKVISLLSRVVLEISDLNFIYRYQDIIDESYVEVEKAPKVEKVNKGAEDSFDEKGDSDLLKEKNFDLLLKKHAKLSAKKFIEEYPRDLLLVGDGLVEINEGIDMSITKFVNNPSKESALELTDEFQRFAEKLTDISELQNILFIIKKLSIIFGNLDHTISYKEHYDSIMKISENLMQWTNDIFVNQSTDDIHYLDKQFLLETLLLEKLFRR